MLHTHLSLPFMYGRENVTVMNTSPLYAFLFTGRNDTHANILERKNDICVFETFTRASGTSCISLFLKDSYSMKASGLPAKNSFSSSFMTLL